VRRDLFNTKLGIQLREDTHLTLIGTDLNQPLSQDPGGLTKAQWDANPKQAGTGAETFHTRATKRHTQVGAKLEHDFDADNAIHLMAYGGDRFNLGYLSVGSNPTGTGLGTTTAKITAATSGSSGGVSQIKRDFGGTDLHYTHKGTLADGTYSLTVGTNYDTMTDDRTGFNNFIALAGPSKICGIGVICGVKGTLRRDEKDSTWDFDQYAQGEWSPTSRLNLLAGVRHSSVSIESKDHFLSNGNQSGKVNYKKTTPVAGVLFKLTPEVNLYANAGKGFETPTLIEMAYSPGGGGFNIDLQPATSNNYEVGAKAFLGTSTRANIALFKIDTDNEIVVADNTNGRASYQNAGGTQRKGVELSVDSEFGNGFTGYASYAYLNAEYSDPFCSGKVASSKSQCTGGTTVYWVQSGKSLPGTYSRTAYAEVAWKYAPAGFSTAVEARAMSKVYVADSNTDTAPGYGLMSWRGGFNQNVRQWQINEFLRVDNLFDRHYIGAIKINDGNKQYYEPAANRNWLLGLSASYQF
jgi:iron complex outermembrane receptor protein